MLCRVALRTQIIKQRINSEVQIKVLIEPMNNPLGVSPSKGNQGTTRGKEKKRSKDIFFASCGSLIPFTRANTQWVIHGFN